MEENNIFVYLQDKHKNSTPKEAMENIQSLFELSGYDTVSIYKKWRKGFMAIACRD